MKKLLLMLAMLAFVLSACTNTRYAANQEAKKASRRVSSMDYYEPAP